MTRETIDYQFSRALYWNAFSYAAYKILFVSLTYTLYYKLDIAFFSLWANINSIVFLVVLWTDCGLSKSVPRFIPVFFANAIAHRSFIKNVITLKSIIMILGLFPTLLYIHSFHAPGIMILILATLLFTTQGIVSISQTIYHAHFWNKEFNSIQTLFTTISMISGIAGAWLLINPLHIIIVTLASTIVAQAAIIGITLCLFPKHNHNLISSPPTIDVDKQHHLFIKHTIMMAGGTILKSLSERNFLMIFFTHALGAGAANIFKMANDSALFLYRIILKTIGTADTALLAHALVQQEPKQSLQDAAKKLIAKVTRLLFPVLGIMIIGIMWKNDFKNDHYGFQLFIIMVIGYCLETLLLPFERVLEVRFDYRYLIYAYVPYVCILALLFFSPLITLLPFVLIIALIHGVRLVSLCVMSHYAYRLYKVRLFVSPFHRR